MFPREGGVQGGGGSARLGQEAGADGHHSLSWGFRGTGTAPPGDWMVCIIPEGLGLWLPGTERWVVSGQGKVGLVCVIAYREGCWLAYGRPAPS